MATTASTRRLLFFWLVGLLVLASASGCAEGGGGPSTLPTQPSVPVSNTLTGTWSGSASDSTGPGQMSWQITQSDSSFAGTVTMTDGGTGLGGRGSVSGTVSNGSIHFSISVSAGGFDSPYESCTAEVSGDGQASTSSLTGTYAGSNSCTDAITSGQLSLTRQ
jgi:hypothetical protein